MTDVDTLLHDWAREELADAPDVPWPQWNEHAPHRTRWVLALASAAAVIIAVAVAIVVVRDRGHAPPTVAAPDPTALYGVTWLEPTTGRTLVFRPGALYPSGCVNYDRYTLFSGDTLRLGAELPNQAARLCTLPEYVRHRASAAVSRRLDLVLAGTMHWSVDGTTLTLALSDATSVSLTSNGTARLTLPGSRWVLRTYGPLYRTDDTVSRRAELDFGMDGTFRANDLCGGVSGHYTVVDDDSVTFQPLTFGDECTTSEGTKLAAAAYQLFNGRAYWAVFDNQLLLVSDRPRTELRYAPA